MARILFLTREPRLYSMRRLAEACVKGGHRFLTLDASLASLAVGGKGPVLWDGGDPVRPEDIDVVVPRIGTGITDAGCMAVQQLESMGLPVVNTSRAILDARDKMRAIQLMAARGVHVPRTLVVRGAEDVDDAIAEVGLPCVLKLLKGTQGIGVMLAESREGLEATLQAFWSLGHTVLLQQFVAESRGRDVRAFVVGGEVVGAMRREARYGEFRSNIHRGGVGKPVKLTPAQQGSVLEAARAVGLEVAGVDYLESKDGPLVIEVNASPGFEGLEAATGLDIAGRIVAHAASRARIVEPSKPKPPVRRGGR